MVSGGLMEKRLPWYAPQNVHLPWEQPVVT
jgi:hypothetical protein